ncbi:MULTISPECIES: relaxase/mobilization nuclease domain-containing protein [unclassified Gemella]|uniref:relaxase/mobilization nuclease domain-containing protein n=1 Tax=unclassified Gemella TaxID=2624949 RepID=UPI001074115E|nr:MULTISPECIES: relaxase/mobilization nuclease domain-containing protein [unclassified Gemella]MBF0710163.1 relaxase/mobilization nuclease domain-containing protein [Gemella sp. GL1.1]MBF0746464.1 relaxase/mobilization nuclease domain-containing protein [Gemella sp. 19428wG2_WT2a]NYS27507.1 relaxase/mobilization nuclease domain-containing protein [Gemella sp. GL1]TFU60244.1 relaxase [Gemella sp. WT2a]
MVITKVFQIKKEDRLNTALNYINNKEKINSFSEKEYNDILQKKVNYIIDENKTLKSKNKYIDSVDMFINENGEKELVSAYGIAYIETAFYEMMLTKDEAIYRNINRQGNKDDVLAHHIIQSFSPEDNLNPEEVHEVGRRTVIELTNGEHEFLIATHLDKEHLHNHIIFNSTNNVTLKKFRWQKGTKKSLENISDKHADLFGAKIIERENIIDHKKYEAYRQKNSYRYEIKNKLNFLIKHSNSYSDFKEKAKLLNIKVVDGRKELRYKLLNSSQERFIRDRSLSKKGNYSKEKIEIMTKANVDKHPKENIVKLYEIHKKEIEDNFDIRFFIEPWQISEETNRGLYVNVEFGFLNRGTVFVPHNKLEKRDDYYEAFIKRNDFFYFVNPQKSEDNKFIKATTFAKQISIQNGEAAIYKNYNVNALDRLLEEFSFLSKNNVTGYSTFVDFQNRLQDTLEKTQNELNRLDSRIAELNKVHALLLKNEKSNQSNKVVTDIFKKLRIPKNTNRKELDRLLKEVRQERSILNSKFNSIVHEYKYAKDIEKNVEVRNKNIIEKREIGREKKL